MIELFTAVPKDTKEFAMLAKVLATFWQDKLNVEMELYDSDTYRLTVTEK